MPLNRTKPSSPLDKDNMLGYIQELPENLDDAWALGQVLPLPDLTGLEHVVICGMGGSAIGGDLLAAHARMTCPVPVIVHRDYGLPAWVVGPQILVICSSHSGNTEETLSSFKTAFERHCALLVVSTGGRLAQLAQASAVPAWAFNHVGQPRTAIAFSFGLLLALFDRLGLVRGAEKDIKASISAMRSQREFLGDEIPLAKNPARRLAGQLVGRHVTIMAAGEHEVIARRWKTQLNELTKAWAQFEALPEADHNSLSGTLNPEELISRLAVIFLRSTTDHPRNQHRLRLTREAFIADGLLTDEVWGQGETPLAQMWTLLQFGDYVSYYLALLYGVDPTPVEALATLKNRLSTLE